MMSFQWRGHGSCEPFCCRKHDPFFVNEYGVRHLSISLSVICFCVLGFSFADRFCLQPVLMISWNIIPSQSQSLSTTPIASQHVRNSHVKVGHLKQVSSLRLCRDLYCRW